VSDDAAEDPARAYVEGREQRARPVTSVLELVADDATMIRVKGVTARQRLHRLFIDAKDDSVLGGVHVETADPSHLRAKVNPRTHTYEKASTRSFCHSTRRERVA
jgi:hypothetical protein